MLTIIRQRLDKKIKSLLLKHTFASSPKTIYYFGYGANIDPDFMESRGFSFTFIGPAKLEGYRFLFNTPCEYFGKGFGGIEPCPDHLVYGALYKISKESLDLLDCLEWVRFHFYVRKEMIVYQEGNAINAQTYVPVHSKKNLKAPRGYKNLILNGAKKIGCPNGYISYLETLQCGKNFSLDNSFNLSNPGKKRLFPSVFYFLHDKIRERLCTLI